MSPATSTEFLSPRPIVESGKVKSVPELFEWHARENAKHPFFRYHDGDKLNDINCEQLAGGIRRAARYINSQISSPSIVAVFANADTVTYITTSLGVLRAGHSLFLISGRNVPAAVADMLRRTGCRHIIVSPDSTIQSLSKAVSDQVEGVSLHPIPPFADLFAPNASGATDAAGDLPNKYDEEELALILHSSGSTNHPKPIRWTHKRLMKMTVAPWFGDVSLAQSVLSVHGTPMFHGVGVMMWAFAASAGWTLATFPPQTPPVIPTTENVFEGIIKTSSQFVTTAPAFIEPWSRDPSKVVYMKTMRGILYGGAPLDQRVGDALTSQGVTIYSAYGSSELGPIAKAYPVRPGKDWEYFQINPQHEAVLVDKGDNKSELVVLSPQDAPIPVANTTLNGKDAYASNDLLEPHPTRAGWWRYYGRVDDQIILSNGEKTNPGPIENIIGEDPHVQNCVVFGQGKFQNGVLIDPKADHKFDPQNATALEDFRNKIWTTIERANDFAPQHSRIFKEMIIVTSPSKPFTYGIKGLPRRDPALRDYADEIDAVYAAVAESAQSDIAGPIAWDTINVQAFLRVVVEKVLRKPIADEADLFRNGCDSLQATWIRNAILHAVRQEFPAAAQRIHANVVFQAPTINALTGAVLGVVHNSSSASSGGNTPEDLIRIAEQYATNLPARPATLRTRENGKDVILITGTTGGFGCDVLEHLLRDDSVAKVYAFNRRGTQALDRQHARFRERGLDESLLSSSKFVMVEAVLDAPDFGLQPALLNEIRASITHIMHNAWTVNFVLSLRSFEADLRGTRNLIDLALSSPYSDAPRILFISSIGIFGHCTLPPPVPEVLLDPSSAVGAGYPESKWVVEQVLHRVSERAGLPAVVVRLGQVTGNKVGYWNEREWFPALVKSALFTHCLPDVEGTVSSFIPGYPAARAFAEMRNSSEPILHLVHPRAVRWSSIIAPIAAELGVPLVTYDEWLAALVRTAGAEGSDQAIEAMQKNPALRLLDFFRAGRQVKEGCEPLGLPHLSTEKAKGASATLATMTAIGETEAKAWVTAWRAVGFLDVAGK
ncbi:acetyl-CoA synthetase-like protein [Ganoderma leucocontextum]|nr:acetyl-CoA synthetase-like protein [Ganoderma leucocontextum]